MSNFNTTTTYEHELDFKIKKYIDPMMEADYVTVDEFNLLETKVREFFLESRIELLDIRVIGKIQDILTEFNISPAYSQTAIKVSEVDGKFTVVVKIDPDDPYPARTLEFVTTEFNNIHPGVEVTVLE